MKTFQKISLALVLMTMGEAWALTSASELLIRVYQVAVSTSTSCTSPQIIFTSPAGTEVNFLSNPVLGGGEIADGTYPCVMINMSDVIKYRPIANDGDSCIAGTQYSLDVCRAESFESTDLLIGGSAVNVSCTGTTSVPNADQVTLYLFTTSPGTGSTFRSGAGNGLPLTSAFVVAGSTSAKFVVNPTNKVSDEGSACGMQPPTFGFTNL